MCGRKKVKSNRAKVRRELDKLLKENKSLKQKDGGTRRELRGQERNCNLHPILKLIETQKVRN